MGPSLFIVSHNTGLSPAARLHSRLSQFSSNALLVLLETMLTKATVDQISHEMNGNNTQHEEASGDGHAGLNGNDVHRGNVLVVSCPLHSHLVAAYRFAKQLAQRGVTITFVGFKNDISSFVGSKDLEGLDFQFVGLPDPDSVPLDLVKHKVSPFSLSAMLQKAFQPYLQQLLEDQKAGKAVPTCIMADRFLVWAGGVANTMNILSYQFFSNGAADGRFMFAVPELVNAGRLNVKNGFVQEYAGTLVISGLPPLEYRNLPKPFRQAPVGFVSAIGESMWKTDGLIFNTYYDLEAGPIDALRAALAEKSQGKDIKVLTVGPLFTYATASVKTSFSGSVQAGSEYLEWLDTRPHSSVLYICLGSTIRLDEPQINELALALEASEQNFLWVLPLRKGNFSSVDEVLPTGFLSRTEGRGRVVTGWVPQQQLLAHSAIGAFLTHGGWNSLLESATNGVPMLSWPHGAEQQLNSKYAVSDLKIALEIGGDRSAQEQSMIVEAQEFERVIRKLMVDEEGKVMKMRAKELQAKAKSAIDVGGSTIKDVDELVRLVSR